MHPEPRLERVVIGDIAVWTDPELADAGVRIAFSERIGGVSVGPYASLNLAAHVEDDPTAVDVNRARLLGALALPADRLVTSEQVHGERIAVVGEADAGAGAKAASGRERIPGTDALVTSTPELPLMLLYADCVPVILVALGERPAVSVVHAGWRGALARLPEKSAAVLAREARVEPSELLAYVGPHIGECCYPVDASLLSQFGDSFATIGRASGRLDLAAAVSESLSDAGIPVGRQCRLGMCTMDHPEAFYSYRAEKRTGRHSAVAAVVKTDR